jgi:hypothetical protein
MYRVIVKDRLGRVEPNICKISRLNRVEPWRNDCTFCIQYFKGENTNPRWAHNRWAKFSNIPWEDIEYEVSKIVQTGAI